MTQFQRSGTTSYINGTNVFLFQCDILRLWPVRTLIHTRESVSIINNTSVTCLESYNWGKFIYLCSLPQKQHTANNWKKASTLYIINTELTKIFMLISGYSFPGIRSNLMLVFKSTYILGLVYKYAGQRTA